jgi:hypothetical protein
VELFFTVDLQLGAHNSTVKVATIVDILEDDRSSKNVPLTRARIAKLFFCRTTDCLGRAGEKAYL